MSPNFARCVFIFTLLFFAAFFFWPILQILRGGFIDADGNFTLSTFVALLQDPLYREGLLNSFWLGLATTAIAFAIALPLAFISDRFEFPGKAALASVVLVPMILPPFVGAIGIKQIFGQYGALNAFLIELGLRPEGWTFDWFAIAPFWGVALVSALSLYPIIYLNCAAALANVDPAMEEAAQNLGCTGLRRFRRVTLPLIKPGLFAGGTIVFIAGFTELGVPLIFDYSRLTSVQIFYGLKDIGGNPAPYALVTLLLLSTTTLYLLGKGLFGRQAYAMMAKASSTGGARRLPLARALFCTALFGGVTALAVLPHIGVVLMAFASDWYGNILPSAFTLENFELALGHPLTVSAISNSIKFAAASTVIDIVLGIAIAYVVVRSKLRYRGLLDVLAMLPLAVPGLVVAFGYLAMGQVINGMPATPLWTIKLATEFPTLFSNLPELAKGTIEWMKVYLVPTNNPTILLIIAYSVRRLPYVVRSAVAGFQQTSETLEEAAQNLGCPPLRTLRKITLPLIAANLIAGGLLAFAFAMLEVSDSLILAQKQAFYPITKAILELFQLLGDGQFIASALGVWAMAFLGICIVGLSLVLGKKLGAIFRV
jgi:iron(III) transport system permease protein